MVAHVIRASTSVPDSDLLAAICFSLIGLTPALLAISTYGFDPSAGM